MRQHIKPVSWLVFHRIVAVIDVDVVLVIIMVMIMVMGVPIIDAILPPVGVPIMALRNLQNSHPGHLVQARHSAQPNHHAVEPRSGGRERVPVLGEVNRRGGSAPVQNVGLPVARMFDLSPRADEKQAAKVAHRAHYGRIVTMICCVITRRVMTWEVKMDMHRMFLPASWWRTP
jgi:hypothetical protein